MYRNKYHTTDQTDGFADVPYRKVTAMLEWLEDTDRERFISLMKHSYRGIKTTRYVDGRYTLTQRKSFPSQGACMNAWENRKFPAHHVSTDRTHGMVARSYSSQNFTAYHHTDGTGRVEHYSTLAAIRTRNGKVFNNTQDYGNGFARVTRASDSDGTIPLTTIQESDILPEGCDIYDITAVHQSQTLRENTRTWQKRQNGSQYRVAGGHPTLVELSDGSGLVIVRDPSAKNSHENTAMFHVTPGEIRGAESVKQLEALLKPEPVKMAEARGMDVVATDAMAPNRSGSRYEDRGDVIQRQGEWYFIPVGDDLADATGGMSHTDGVPRECTGCGETRFEVAETVTTCKDCGHRHYTESPDSHDELGSHTPTHFLPAGNSAQEVVTDGGRDETDETETAGYVRGTVRHTREHYMARLGDTWHLAVTHGRDAVVIDTSTPRHGRGRGMRWD